MAKGKKTKKAKAGGGDGTQLIASYKRALLATTTSSTPTKQAWCSPAAR